MRLWASSTNWGLNTKDLDCGAREKQDIIKMDVEAVAERLGVVVVDGNRGRLLKTVDELSVSRDLVLDELAGLVVEILVLIEIIGDPTVFRKRLLDELEVTRNRGGPVAVELRQSLVGEDVLLQVVEFCRIVLHGKRHGLANDFNQNFTRQPTYHIVPPIG